LVALSIGLNARGGRGSGKTGRSKYFRLPGISNEVIENLEFWSIYLSKQQNPEWPYLIIAPVARSWIDLIVGEPVSNDFYCLKADETTVPVASVKIEDPWTRRLEAEAGVGAERYSSNPPVMVVKISWPIACLSLLELLKGDFERAAPAFSPIRCSPAK
jgi:hypothetical protein